MTRRKRNYQSNKKVEHIGELLERCLCVEGFAQTMKEVSIVRKWPEIVGERIAAVTECREISDGVLRVQVKSSAWRQELCFMKGDLIKSVFRETGGFVLKDIVFF